MKKAARIGGRKGKNMNPYFTLGRDKPTIRVRDDTVIPAGFPMESTADREAEHRAAVARLNRMAQDAQINQLNAKFDRVLELIAARRNAAIPSHKDSGPSAETMAAQYAAEYSSREARICAEAKAAYDARNPHKQKAGSQEAAR